MQQNKELRNNVFNAKDVGEGLGVTSRTASGAMRKLVTDGYVEKIGTNPVIYSLTTSGITVNVEEE
jgi:predicted transcriptional regulator